MAIKDKDGSVYKLRGPNPLLKTQDTWDERHVKLVNFGWDSVTVADEHNPVKKFEKDYNIPDLGKLLEAHEEEGDDEDEDEDEVPDHDIEEVPEGEPAIDHTTAEFLEKNKTIFQGVLTKETQITDDLYGETYTKRVYSGKIQFPAIVIQQTDLGMEFWTTQDVTEHSVVYPQDGTKRWWRVTGSYQKSGGYVVTAVTSDVNPDFSN